MNKQKYDVVILGGGVIGSALLFMLKRYSNLERVALIEKEAAIGEVSSHSKQNSQTLHFGDIETNYTHEKAARVKVGAEMMLKYLKQFDKKGELYEKFYKMVLGVGEEEVKILEERYEDFKDLFPELQRLDGEALAKIEPCMMDGRDCEEAVLALYSENGYTVDYGALAKSFVKESGVKEDVFLDTKVKKIVRDENEWVLQTSTREFRAKFLVVSAGSYSLYFAKKLGFAKGFSLLPVAGDFYHSPKYLSGKVYTIQNPSIPFAAAHGDPDLDYPKMNRFGPIAGVRFWLEAGRLRSMGGFLKTFGFSWRALVTSLKLLFNRVMGGFILKHFFYGLPWVGRYFFVKEVRRIIPKIKANELKLDRELGGIRPQVLNEKTMKLDFGNAKIEGEGILFNVTPSPGASVCLQNALADVEILEKFFGKDFQFDWEKMKGELA